MSGRLEEARAVLDAARDAAREQHESAPDLFAVPAPEQTAVTTAIERPLTHAGPVWAEHVAQAIRAAALEQDELTVLDVWRHVDTDRFWTYDKRAIGPALRRAAHAGVIRRVTGVYVTSPDPAHHGRPLAVWRSRLRGENR